MLDRQVLTDKSYSSVLHFFILQETADKLVFTCIPWEPLRPSDDSRTPTAAKQKG